jgi:hypothetical protein
MKHGKGGAQRLAGAIGAAIVHEKHFDPVIRRKILFFESMRAGQVLSLRLKQVSKTAVFMVVHL